MRRMFDLQEEWDKMTGRGPRIPQAGTLVDSHPDVIATIQESLYEAVDWTKQNLQEVAQLGAPYPGGMQAPIIAQSLPRMQFEMMSAADAREDLEFFFNRLKELSPAVIGRRFAQGRLLL